MNRDKVTFSPNIPTQVILDGPGTLQPSVNGADEYRYILAHERIMWVPPEVHAQIQRHGAAEGDAITITKHKTSKAGCTWTVEHEAEEPAAAGIRAAATAPASRTPTPQQRPAATSRLLDSSTPEPGELPEITPLHAQLFGCIAAAIDAARDAEAYAQAHGYPQHFNAEDVRAIAITAYIQTARSGGRA
jgi:hypothetical protein